MCMKMNQENASYLQVIIAKKSYLKVIIAKKSYLKVITILHYSTNPSIFLSIKRAIYVHEKFLLHTHFGQHISTPPQHMCKLRN
jgi:hypothetical protein